MGNQYTLGCLSLNDGVATTHISLTSVDFPLNAEISGNDSGEIYEEFQSLTRQAPKANFTSKCIATLLEFISINGTCVGASFPVTQADVISRRMTDCQTALGGTPHIRDRVSTGLLTLGNLSAQRGADATLTGMLDAITDGTNAPVARTDGVALPSPVVSERFTLGALKIDAVVYPEVESVSIDFGVSLAPNDPSLGSIWPDVIGVIKVLPSITITGRDLSKVAAALVTAGAASAGHADTLIQLIKRQNAGTFVAFGTSEHIGITAAGLVVPENLVSATANQRATHTIRLACSYDGTNAPILFDLTHAYDTTP